MQNIGIITEYVSTGNFFKDFFNKFRYKILPVTEYGFNFVVAGDNCNCSRIFNKHNVEYVVISTSADISVCDYQVIDGAYTYKKMLPEMVRKTIKANQHTSTVAIVDKCFSADCETLADKLCWVCNSLVFVTDNTAKADKMCDLLMEKYGAAAEVAGVDRTVKCDVAVVLEHCGKGFDGCGVVFDMHGRPTDRTVTDFYIPFKVKPPEGVSNLVFADCIKSIDNI